MFWYSITPDRQDAFLCFSCHFTNDDENIIGAKIAYKLFYALGSNDLLEALIDMINASEKNNLSIALQAKQWLEFPDQESEPHLACAEAVNNIIFGEDKCCTGYFHLPLYIAAPLKANPLAIRGKVNSIKWEKMEFVLEDGSKVSFF